MNKKKQVTQKRLWFCASMIASVFLGLIIWQGQLHSATRIEKTVYIPPGSSHEECIEIDKNSPLLYDFDSSKALTFDLHYHIGQQAFYPIPEQRRYNHASQFNPQYARKYCLQWVNNNQTLAKLSLQYAYRP